MSVAYDETSLRTALAMIGESGLEEHSIEEPLRAAIAEQNARPLLTWAQARGALHGQTGDPIKLAVGEALALARALDGIPLGTLKGDRLASALATASIEAYIRTRSEQAGTVSPLHELQDRVAELTALHRVISSANSSLKLSDMLCETAQAVVAVTHADICSIFLYEPERDQLVLTATSESQVRDPQQVRLQLGEGITGWAAMAGVPVAVSDVRTDPRFKFVSALHEDKATSVLAVPVVLFTNEKLVGAITVQTFLERAFSENETRFLEMVAGEIAIAIENARLYEQTDAQLRQKVAELTTLQGVSAHIAATLNASEVLALVAHQAAHLIHADAATIYAHNPEAGTLDQVAHYNLRDPRHNIYEGKIGPRISLDVERSEIAQAVMRGIPVAMSPGADAELGLSFGPESYRSMFCVPLVAPRNIMGGICIYDREERTFSEEQVHLLDAFAHEAAIALENSRLYEAALSGLQIKSTMLQEMNHRVRNNLQTVAGLLSMQLRRLPQEGESATAIRESIARIQSMAAVHDLMTGRDAVSTSLYDLARQVAEAAVSTLLNPGFSLRLVIEPARAEHIRVDSQQATLLALLLNELVSNAILHGFAGRERGRLVVSAWTGDEAAGDAADSTARASKGLPTVTIEVRDDGVGLPKGFDQERDAHLGLNIVRTMVAKDLRGEFEIGRARGGKGTVARIRYAHRPGELAPPPIGDG